MSLRAGAHTGVAIRFPFLHYGVGQGMDKKEYYVYILTNNTGTTLYIGVTNDLLRRVYQHKNELDPKSFTAKYGVHKLVYFESTSDVYAALEREKQLKGWNRARKK